MAPVRYRVPTSGTRRRTERPRENGVFVIVGMLRLMRVLSVVNPLVLAVLVGLCGRASMMEGYVVGGSAGVVFVAVFASAFPLSCGWVRMCP